MPVGFHDAFVAAGSQKAAAEAWGTDASVFARKEAELVTDPALTEAPLASPGQVIKRLRGTAEEQIAALGRDDGPQSSPVRKAVAKPKPKPRPSRAELDRAEQELEAAAARHREQRAAFAEREAELARQRKAMEARQREEQERLEAQRHKAEAKYDQAMQSWRRGE